MTGALRLRYGAHSVVLELDPSAECVRSLLAAYLSPYFDLMVDDAQPAIARISVHVGHPPTEAPRFAGAPLAPIDASKGFLRLDGASVDEGPVRWVELRPQAVTVRIDRGAARIDLWGTTPEHLQVPTLRVVEDLILNEAQRQGGVVLHASAVVVDGRAILAVGNKGAGKTSILCEALHGFEVAKLANDNVCLMRTARGKLVARGWPAFFKVGAATVATYPELADDFPRHHRATLHDDQALWAVYEKVALYPRQGAERFGANVIPEAELGALIFPRFRTDAAPSLRAAGMERLAERMRGFLQGIGNPNHSEWIGLNPVDPRAVDDALRSLFDNAGDEIAVYELTWAPSLESLLARIPQFRPAKTSLRACAAAMPRADGWPHLPPVMG